MNKLTIRFGVLLLAILLLIAPKVGAFRTALASQTATPTPQEINFPELTGPYKVGLTSFEWVDRSRDETLASIPGLKRDLMVYIWFPASPAKRAKVAPYMGSDLMWDLMFKHPRLGSLVHSHAYNTNSLNADKPSYPVLIFAPGLTGASLNYSSIIEEIVSHGYIVIGTSHPYTAAVVNYPDGRVVIGGFVGQGRSMDSSLLAIWTQDIRFVLDQAEILNMTDDKFKGHLDLTRIGVFGHSFGGLTAIEVSAIDPRVKAGAGLEASGGSIVINTNVVSNPFLFVGTGLGSEPPQDKYSLFINGMGHLNYGDFGLLLPLVPDIVHIELDTPLGAIDPVRGIKIVNSYLLAFFDHYLKGSDLKWPIYDEAKLITVQ